MRILKLIFNIATTGSLVLLLLELILWFDAGVIADNFVYEQNRYSAADYPSTYQRRWVNFNFNPNGMAVHVGQQQFTFAGPAVVTMNGTILSTFDVLASTQLHSPEGNHFRIDHSNTFPHPVGGWIDSNGFFLFHRSSGADDEISLAMPHWVIAIMFLILPVVRFAVRERDRQKRRNAAQVCVTCGYDLRASSGRCPECGTVIEIVTA